MKRILGRAPKRRPQAMCLGTRARLAYPASSCRLDTHLTSTSLLAALYTTEAAAGRSTARSPAPTSTSSRTPSSYTAYKSRPATTSTSSSASSFPDPQPAKIPPATTADLPSSSSAPSTSTQTSPDILASDTYANSEERIDWANSFHGLSTTPFPPEVSATLQKPLDDEDVEIKPDGIIYLPEIKYRRILNSAFGPGGWGLAPRSEQHVGEKLVSRTYALVAHGRFVSEARGECQYFGVDTVTTAGEGCKSNALMRCCKDLGIASELWDPRYIRTFKKKHAHEIWVEHVPSKKKRQIWTLKGVDPTYPYKKS